MGEKCMKIMKKGKAAIIIDGQFGSTGKGLLAGWLAGREEIDIATTNAGPNAGHTCMHNGHKIVTHHLPMAACLNPGTTAYLNAGSIINPDELIAEAQLHNTIDRLVIHPRACVISPEDIETERQDKTMRSIASTARGVGAAQARKILRSACLAECNDVLRPFVHRLDLNKMMKRGSSVLVECPQGMGIGINSGLSYPYCTCREISVSQALSDAGIHPHFLGTVLATFRTYPIRVGNLIEMAADGEKTMVGWSGPSYDDQQETNFASLGIDNELTTTTRRPRRIFTFSRKQYEDAIELLRPDVVFLNFVNYLGNMQRYRDFVEINMSIRRPDLLGLGPSPSDIIFATIPATKMPRIL